MMNGSNFLLFPKDPATKRKEGGLQHIAKKAPGGRKGHMEEDKKQEKDNAPPSNRKSIYVFIFIELLSYFSTIEIFSNAGISYRAGRLEVIPE
jgi:hypothetical protein